jgi:hypothetical protein
MFTQTVQRSSRLPVQLLAVLSCAAFWLLPFSPFIAMAAVSKTSDACDWSRRTAVTGAVLCSVYTVVLASWMVYACLRWLPNG